MNSLDDLVAAARDSLIKGLVFDTSLSPGWNDPPPPRGTLFAQVRSPGEARDMLDRRELLLVDQVPLEMGGPETDANLVCIPAYAADLYRFALISMMRLYDEGLLDTVRAEIGYHQGSVVAESVRWTASHSGRAVPAYQPSLIHIW